MVSLLASTEQSPSLLDSLSLEDVTAADTVFSNPAADIVFSNLVSRDAKEVRGSWFLLLLECVDAVGWVNIFNKEFYLMFCREETAPLHKARSERDVSLSLV